MCRRRAKVKNKKRENVHYEIERQVRCTFIIFSATAITISAIYTVAELLYYQMLNLIQQSVKPSVLLNLDITA